jgi:hypothetical protein
MHRLSTSASKFLSDRTCSTLKQREKEKINTSHKRTLSLVEYGLCMIDLRIQTSQACFINYYTVPCTYNSLYRIPITLLEWIDVWLS